MRASQPGGQGGLPFYVVDLQNDLRVLQHAQTLCPVLNQLFVVILQIARVTRAILISPKSPYIIASVRTYANE
jgi:hypothetical protein